MIGEVGIQEELDLKGIAHIGGPADGDRKVSLKAGEFMHHDPDVSCHLNPQTLDHTCVNCKGSVFLPSNGFALDQHHFPEKPLCAKEA